MKLIKTLVYFSIGLVMLMATAQAAIDVYQFDNADKSERFKELTAELRCPKCQNQNIADSNAEIAKDLRNKLQEMLVANKSDEEIVKYMVDRYGDFVLYEPRVDPQTYLLWFGPVLLLLIAFFVVFMIVRMRSKETKTNQLDTNQQEQLSSLLNKQKD